MGGGGGGVEEGGVGCTVGVGRGDGCGGEEGVGWRGVEEVGPEVGVGGVMGVLVWC